MMATKELNYMHDGYSVVDLDLVFCVLEVTEF